MDDSVAFLYRVLDVIARGEIHDEVWWHCTGGQKAPEIFVNCSDVFAWACADGETITPRNIQFLEQAIDECEALDAQEWIAVLFCAKSRGMRPQSAAYPKNNPKVVELLDACGPPRDVTFANPYKHPSDGGGYAYVKEREC